MGRFALRAVRGAVTGVVALSAQFALPCAEASAAANSPTIWTDATGPLITSTYLAPGEQPPSCVAVSWTQLASRDVGLYVSATGGLASYLSVRVDVGYGGGYGDCTGFAGTPVFGGTLEQFDAAHGSPESALSVVAPRADSGTLTYRFTFTLADDDAAQGLTAGAGFTWEVLAAGAPLVLPSPSRRPEATPSTAPTASTAPSIPATPPVSATPSASATRPQAPSSPDASAHPTTPHVSESPTSHPIPAPTRRPPDRTARPRFPHHRQLLPLAPALRQRHQLPLAGEPARRPRCR